MKHTRIFTLLHLVLFLVGALSLPAGNTTTPPVDRTTTLVIAVAGAAGVAIIIIHCDNEAQRRVVLHGRVMTTLPLTLFRGKTQVARLYDIHMQMDWKDIVSIVLGLIIAIITFFVPYRILPDWIAYGFPLPWRVVYAGPLMIFIEHVFVISLVLDPLIWIFLFRTILRRIKPLEQSTQASELFKED